jgi:hypothetical protein
MLNAFPFTSEQHCSAPVKKEAAKSREALAFQEAFDAEEQARQQRPRELLQRFGRQRSREALQVEAQAVAERRCPAGLPLQTKTKTAGKKSRKSACPASLSALKESLHSGP